MSSRRRFLRCVGSTGVLASVGWETVRARQSDEDDEADEDTEPNGDGGDEPDEPHVTRVIAGPDGDWSFEPEEVTIGLGETVEWEFDSPGHNVTAHPDADDETSVPEDAEHFASYEGDDHMAVDEEGTTYEHTFTVPGEYVYVCTPHVPQMVGTVQVEPCVDETVTVAPDGENAFDPADVEIDLGNTVAWEFEADGHNVSSHPDASDETSVPENADPFASYEGDDHDETVAEGETFVHVFEEPGEYEYVCTQHDEEMVGTVEVRDEPAAEVTVGADGENEFDPEDAELEVGDVLRWVFEADGHNVSTHPDAADETSVPGDADHFASYEGDDHDETVDEGEAFDHRFVAVGEYEYVCTQHDEMEGTVAVEPCATDADEDDDETDDDAADEDEAANGDTVEVIAGPDGNWSFDPEDVEISVGDTVEWYFDSPGHNVTSHPDASDRNENPDDADPFQSYEGDNHMAINEEGTTYEHTFEEPGEYVYVCTPHENSMIGTVLVSE
ncbi:plastocyanin/azurin family copper-binding protein [Natrialbaceae archaeon A-arb3/5]